MGRLSRFDVAVAMLALATLRGWGWDAVPDSLKGMASKGAGGMALLAMIWLAHNLVRPSLAVAIAASVWSVGELQVVLCSVWYMFDPWFVPLGRSICSVRLDLDLGAAGVVLIAWALWFVVSHERTAQH